jgi:hypothetical protein
VEHNIGSSSIAFVYLEDLLIHFRLFGLLLILKQLLALLKTKLKIRIRAYAKTFLVLHYHYRDEVPHL